jgi:hypothetical protein
MRSGTERLTGRQLDGRRDAKFVFGAYVQVHPTATNNSMDGRTTAAIALLPTGNLDGSWYFLNIKTWSVFVRNTATALAIPDPVLDVLNRKADKDWGTRKQKLAVNTWKTAAADSDDESEIEEEEDAAAVAEYEAVAQLEPARIIPMDAGLDLDPEDVPTEDDEDSDDSSVESDDSAVEYEVAALPPATIDDIFDRALDTDCDDDDSQPVRDSSPPAGVAAEPAAAADTDVEAAIGHHDDPQEQAPIAGVAEPTGPWQGRLRPRRQRASSACAVTRLVFHSPVA